MYIEIQHMRNFGKNRKGTYKTVMMRCKKVSNPSMLPVVNIK